MENSRCYQKQTGFHSIRYNRNKMIGTPKALETEKLSVREHIDSIISDKRIRSIVVCVFASGIMAHGMAAFNKYAFHDELYSMFGYNIVGTYPTGRWGAELMEYFYRLLYGGLNYSLSSFGFLAAMIYSCLIIWMIIRSLRIRNETVIGLLSALIAVYPVVTVMMGYNFTIPFTHFGYFLGVLSVYLYTENPNIVKVLIGIIAGVFSLALYQAVLPLILTFILVKVLQNTLLEEYPGWREYITIILKTIMYCVAIVGLYFVSVKISLLYHSAELSSYRGINTYGITSFKGYLTRLADAYKYSFLHWGPLTDIFPQTMGILKLLIFIICIILSLIILVNLVKTGKSIIAVETLILLIVFPLTYNFIYLMTEPSYIHGLMLYSQFFIFVLLVMLVEKASPIIPKYKSYLEMLTIFILAVSVLFYIRYDNICYTKTEFAIEEAKAYFIEMKTRIECTEGYSVDKEVLFLNDENKNTDSMYHMDEFNGITLVPYANFYGGNYISNPKWKTFMLYYTGYNPVLYDGDKLQEDERVKALPHYPDDGSISVIDDVVVVNF